MTADQTGTPRGAADHAADRARRAAGIRDATATAVRKDRYASAGSDTSAAEIRARVADAAAAHALQLLDSWVDAELAATAERQAKRRRRHRRVLSESDR